MVCLGHSYDIPVACVRFSYGTPQLLQNAVKTLSKCIRTLARQGGREEEGERGARTKDGLTKRTKMQNAPKTQNAGTQNAPKRETHQNPTRTKTQNAETPKLRNARRETQKREF